MKKLGPWTWADLYRAPLAWMLLPIILNDYRLRKAGKRPDRWHWADVRAANWGFFVTWRCV